MVKLLPARWSPAHFGWLALLVGSGSCGGPTVPELPSGAISLSAPERLLRISMAVRGIRPTVAELDEVEADPAAIERIADGWLESDEFLQTVRDLHAELLKVRVDTEPQLPAMGPMAGTSGWDIYTATTEETLRLVSHLVENDRPYTEILTADYMMTNATLSEIYGIPYDPTGPEWQVSHWSDGRPHAGLLTSSEIYRRWISAGNNFHRGRANFIADAFLCQDFASRAIELENITIDLTDPVAVANAVDSTVSCIGCHQTLDPIAATMWGYKQQLSQKAVETLMNRDCHMEPGELRPEGMRIGEDYCYPIRFYTPATEDAWADYEMRPPAYFGTPISGLVDLGREMAKDPRFHECTVRNFASYLTQTDRDQMPVAAIEPLLAAYRASGFDARALVRAIVLDPAFALAVPGASPWSAPVQVIRPDQYARTIEQLTGFTWWAMPDGEHCEPTCWEQVDLARTDRSGFRALGGGIDGVQVLRSSHEPTPMRLLTMGRQAHEAAAFVVRRDFAAPAAERHLLTAVEPGQTDEDAVRAQLAALHRVILATEVPTDGVDVDEMWALFQGALDRHGDDASAWTVVLATLLQDPRMLFY